MRKLVMLFLAAAVLMSVAQGNEDEAPRAFEEKSRALEPGDVSGHYLLGLWCVKAGLPREAREQFEAVLALSPDHEGARRELGYERHLGRWLGHEAAMRAKGLVLHEGAWMLPEEVERILLPEVERERAKQEGLRAEKILRTMARGDAKVERIAVKAMEGIEDRHKIEPLTYALRHKDETVRTFAAAELGRIGDRRALRPLVFRSIMDPSPDVRRAALVSVKSFGDPNLLAPYVRALYSESQPVRMNAAQAIGDAGEVMGIEYLIFRLSAHGGGVNRSHIYLAKQLSFIQDYDVEVAQTAFIADPMVGILQEGQVLEARVISSERTADIIERRVIRRSLRRLAGIDLGDDTRAWAKWWKENRKELLAKR